VELRLRPLRLDDQTAAGAAHAELSREGFTFLLGWARDKPWPAYVEQLRRNHCGQDLAPGWVPATFLAAVVEGELVGRTSIRHELNEYLAEFGGHIGFAVRPAHRRRGYASEILRQSLVIARAEGVDRVLVTCEDGNVASAWVIERLGAVLEDIRTTPDGRPKRRYWID
jgi:predicted acetyltransferase